MPELSKLIRLLQRIEQEKEHVHVDVDFNGKEFVWRVVQSNVTAEEYRPRSAGKPVSQFQTREFKP